MRCTSFHAEARSREGSVPRALNDLTTTLLHVAPRYFFISTSYGRRMGVAVSYPRVPLSFKLHASDVIYG